MYLNSGSEAPASSLPRSDMFIVQLILDCFFAPEERYVPIDK